MNTTTDTTFTLDRWQELVSEKGTHHTIEIKKRKKVRLICTDRVALWPIVTLERDYNATAENLAYYTVGEAEAYLRIIPNPPKSLGWFNVYPNACAYGYSSREIADQDADQKTQRLACVEIFEGQGL